MPTLTFARAYGTVIVILALLQSLLASTKLSVISQTSSVAPANSTRRLFTNSRKPSSITSTSATMNAYNQTTVVDKLHVPRRSKFYADSSHQQIPDYGYNWHQYQQQQQQQQQQQAYNHWPDYSYHDFQATSMPDLTTIAYPFLTTPQPHSRHASGPLLPRVTKLYVKPTYRRTVNFLDLDDEAEEHMPMSSFFAGGGSGGLYRWPSPIPSLPSVQLTPVTYHSRLPGVHSSDERISSIEHYHGGGGGYGYHAPVIYHHHHEDVGGGGGGHHSSKMDLKTIGIISLVKIGLAKLKMFGILKLLFLILLKFKLLLLILFVKFLLFLKALKHLKALLLPLLLLLALLLLPLLLLPLLLLPSLLRVLLPLLLLIPLPGPARIRGNKADNRLMEYLKTQKSDPLMEILAQMMDAETCVERIACQLAAKKESRLFFPAIKWYLNKLKKILKHERLISYIDTYIHSAEAYEDSEDYDSIDGEQWCQKKHSCVKAGSASDENKKDNPNITSTTTETKYIMINRVTKK